MNNPSTFQFLGIALQIGAFLCFGYVYHLTNIREKAQMKAIIHPNPIEKEFPVKIIAGKIEDEVVNLPIGKDRYPIITDDASTIFTRTEIDEKKRARYDHDIFFYLFLKWMNSNFHQGWSLLHDAPVIDKSQWHEPLADKNVNNSNVLTFADLPSLIASDNIFFSNPKLFENGKFKFALHTKFPIEEFSIILPPETTISFIDSQEGTKIVMDNNYCNATFQITDCSSGPGLPHKMLDPNKRFSESEFYKYLTVNYQISFRAWFKDTENFADQKKYEKWANSLINYFQPYFGWHVFKISS